MDSGTKYTLPVCWTLRGDEMKRRLLASYAHAFHYRIQTSDALVGNSETHPRISLTLSVFESRLAARRLSIVKNDILTQL